MGMSDNKSMENNSILKQIKHKMVDLDWKQEDLAVKSRTDRSNLSKILNGNNWTRDTMIRILTSLDLKDLIKLLK